MSAPAEIHNIADVASPQVSLENADPKPQPKPQRKRPQKPNYAKIHSKPLPLEVYPLPAFIPQNPLSLLRIATAILTQFFSTPPSHSVSPYIGYFSSESRSIHVTDPVHVRALWEMGFFGKGTLSRSEPSWLDREKARLKAGAAGSAEEATRKRREERRMFKLERARAEREQIEQQLEQERAAAATTSDQPATDNQAIETLDGVSEYHPQLESSLSHVFPWQVEAPVEEVRTINDVLSNEVPSTMATPSETQDLQTTTNSEKPLLDKVGPEPISVKEIIDEDKPFEPEEPVVDVNQEHLQLTLEEAFFLSYGLGVLQIRESLTAQNIPTKDFLTLAWRHSMFPPTEVPQLRPDDPFMLNYAVYHYYRSLGWVVRPGVKFSADFMLYNRGPVFSHAEFAVIIIPEYSADAPASEKRESRDWWWLHCVNRVQSQVRKSLVICYVEVPTVASLKSVREGDIGGILRQYKVREFVLRRWLANRSRD